MHVLAEQVERCGYQTDDAGKHKRGSHGLRSGQARE